ncbi:PEP-CTERM sorting domain-containing protein [Phragmitibacter flavus]|uniref:PEP-CTERM sorting domain-containing protein n=1 Tax=Phragmitibacter flavus TaxID=2576071 RepID=A0A5R8KHH1_9BACT|nr:PEP-CTERM sorting domain-containing protein [Phragmitibacter flavus]TLD71764.1 PEP-CTERM sorting domain-containing protein [Phragmitibacter flavus]
MKPSLFSAITLAAAFSAPACFGFTIELDYSLTDTTSGFFSNAAAKAAVDAAAADISALLAPTLLTAISPAGTPNVDNITGTAGGSSATANWSYDFTDPDLGGTVTIASPSLAANTIRIYVGAQPLSGTTLGMGGPSGAGIGLSASISGGTFGTAVDNMETLSNTYMGRGAGPTIGSLSGSIGSESYTLSYGMAIGQLWFDNDGSTTWNFDHTATTFTGSDLYSVALHEILHAIGFGESETWEENVIGNEWQGVTVSGILGGSTAIIDGSGSHLIENLMSWTLGIGAGAPSTSTLQEVVMDPTLTQGTRKYLTLLDAAILTDLGYATVIPEPSRALLLLFGFALLHTRRRR